MALISVGFIDCVGGTDATDSIVSGVSLVADALLAIPGFILRAGHTSTVYAVVTILAATSIYIGIIFFISRAFDAHTI